MHCAASLLVLFASRARNRRLTFVALFVLMALLAVPWLASLRSARPIWGARSARRPSPPSCSATDEIAATCFRASSGAPPPRCSAGVVSVCISLFPSRRADRHAGGLIPRRAAGFAHLAHDHAMRPAPSLSSPSRLAAFLGPSLTNAMIANRHLRRRPIFTSRLTPRR